MFVGDCVHIPSLFSFQFSPQIITFPHNTTATRPHRFKATSITSLHGHIATMSLSPHSHKITKATCHKGLMGTKAEWPHGPKGYKASEPQRPHRSKGHKADVDTKATWQSIRHVPTKTLFSVSLGGDNPLVNLSFVQPQFSCDVTGRIVVDVSSDVLVMGGFSYNLVIT